ncbi:helix-turn-helix domain-containing protein [Sphingomonas sp. CGMCC 1.13654]|uniref:Helix-turn-helix domain-containing protein n=1 Tax=Sphingomonas chungangi TaxID=2683589 RepID=A0A838L1W3_9SPHN|nr:helix-turn-helix domain-containing protein [Sphingomonas chungangi]MBA2933483.1 helix-turn-helix domain-containing protein [Sphingomonas chungangi]MVW54816.1 helix-turn-helix domain-containing protein [Sphingomonas chungangi]
MTEARLWSTSSAPGRELAYWREATCEAVFELELESFAEDSLAASIEQRPFGPLSMSRMSIGFGQRIRRTPSSINRSAAQQFELVYLLDGRINLQQCGREVELAPRQCVLVDSSEQYRLTTTPGSRNMSFHLPGSWLKQWLPQPEAFVARRVTDDSAWQAALISTLDAVARTAIDDDFAPLCANQIAGALALCASEGAAQPIREYQLKLFNRLRQTLSDLAHDNTLDAARLAQSIGISVRYLHAIFATAGTSYSRELLDIRLGRARQMLSDQRFRTLSIAEIAWRCAFFDASHLTRHFRARYDCTPGAFRDRCRMEDDAEHEQPALH